MKMLLNKPLPYFVVSNARGTWDQTSRSQLSTPYPLDVEFFLLLLQNSRIRCHIGPNFWDWVVAESLRRTPLYEFMVKYPPPPRSNDVFRKNVSLCSAIWSVIILTENDKADDSVLLLGLLQVWRHRCLSLQMMQPQCHSK